VVERRATLPLRRLDWAGLSAAECERALQDLLAADRAQGFDLSRAPLMRLALAQLPGGAHRLVWSFHHILLDGWCLSPLLGEVIVAYEALRAGQEVRLKRRRPYRDYVAWLRRQGAGEAERYWRAALKGFTAPTPLGVDKPAVSENEGGTVRVRNVSVEGEAETPEHADASQPSEGGYTKFVGRVPAHVTEALRRFARQEQLTLNVLLRGAWALLLSRYSGERDVLFGATVSGRPPELDGVEEMIGLFINTLPVRAEVPGDARLRPWLKELQRQQVEARQYEHSPLVEVQGWSEVPRGRPLFESLLVFENYPVSESADGGGRPALRVRGVQSHEKVNYPLSLVIAPGDELLLQFFYDTGRFDAATVERMSGHYRTLLEAIASGRELRLAELPLLGAAERQRTLSEWNDTRRDDFGGECLHERVELHAALTPEKEALFFEGKRVSYAQLNARSNRLARHLRTLGVGPETRVGLMLERSVEMVVSVLAVLKAGGAYVPLDPAYPRDRLAFMAEDAGLSVLLTQEGLVGALPTHGARVVSVDAEAAQIEAHGAENLAPSASAEDAAYVIYTSGSTGRPKGAVVTRRGLANLACAQVVSFDIRPDARVLQFASLSFDASIFEIAMALHTGAALVLAKPESLLPGEGLRRLLFEQAVTNVTLPPSALALMPDAELPALRTVVVAGEACPAGLVDTWARGRRFFNAYGPTETTVWATADECFPGGPKPLIGRPISNMQVYLLDRDMNPVPPGVAGELHIGGVGLARGYLNRPALTAERFVPDPFPAEPGARLYRTGDLACYTPEGEIDFLGRIDHQVKVRGFRVEPGEIEAAAERHEGVREAVVVARADAPGEQRLVAYVTRAVSEAGRALDDAGLRSHLRSLLPEHMIPSAFVVLDEMPLTPNGKVDRKALPAPGQPRRADDESYLPPRNELERTIASVWREVLGVEQVGVDDNFFDLGGHSLLMIKANARLREQLKRELSMVDMFQYPTVGALARHLSPGPAQAPALAQTYDRAGRQRAALNQRRHLAGGGER
ncbi:MAG: amino acid adenylation domain-containing protein, partial [Acidobacteria bacterium]|nr:amino acid adenylation domain-containing protein [Acidobacteriota bacterium]